MDAALGFGRAAPAAGAHRLAWRRAARAGHAADRGKAIGFERMVREIGLGEVGRDILRRPGGKRVDLDAPARELDLRQPDAAPTMVALAAVDQGIEAGERALQWQHL